MSHSISSSGLKHSFPHYWNCWHLKLSCFLRLASCEESYFASCPTLFHWAPCIQWLVMKYKGSALSSQFGTTLNDWPPKTPERSAEVFLCELHYSLALVSTYSCFLPGYWSPGYTKWSSYLQIFISGSAFSRILTCKGQDQYLKLQHISLGVNQMQLGYLKKTQLVVVYFSKGNDWSQTLYVRVMMVENWLHLE